VSVVVLYTRPGCHLCEEARERLVALGLDVDERDITADDALHARYLERIPVGMLDGREIFELEVDEDALADALSSPK
jgi:glutaredoxin